MNKKLFSAVMFGALLLGSASTFVSCKDYDDDITNLQEQINKLASKDEMSAQVAALQAALSTAQTTAQAAQTSAQEAVNKANGVDSKVTEAEKAAAQAALEAANAKVEAIAAAQAEVAAVKTQLETTVDSKFADLQAELAATIDELTEKVEKMTGLTTKMITSINLQTGADYESGTSFWSSLQLLSYNKMPASWTVSGKTVTSKKFGKDLAGEFTLTANELFTKPTTFLISVEPANAVVTPNMLSIINTKGESLNSYLDITVAPYTGLLTRTATGVHAVTVALKKTVNLTDLDKAIQFVDATTGVITRVGFAVAASDDNGRDVTTPFNLTFRTNPVSSSLTGLSGKSTIKSSIEDKKFLSSYSASGSTAGSGSTTVDDEDCYPVVAGEAFNIAVADDASADVLASYVTVDINNAALSTTDKAALRGMTITGVDAVSYDNSFDITISGTHAAGVVVPLKVTAIGFDGKEVSTIVWVKAGGRADIAQTAAYVITPDQQVATPTAYAYSAKQAFTVPANAAKFDLKIFEDGEVNIAVSKAAVLGNSTFKFFKSNGTTVATANNEVAKAQLNATVNLQTMKDNKVYTGSVKFFDAEGTFLSQSTVTLQKVLPTTLPEGFSVKTNQLNAEGVYNSYLQPASWAADNSVPNTNTGTMPMSHVFNFGVAPAAGYEITFADAKLNAAGDALVDNKVDGSQTLNIWSAFIDNETKHNTTVVYNYGNISSEKDADGNWIPCTVSATAFPTIFSCIYNDTYSWRWATHQDLGHTYNATTETWSGSTINTTLTYGTAATVDVTANIQGVSARDGLYNAKLKAPYNNSLKIKEAHLISNGNNEVDEYFTVNYTANSTTIAGFTVNSSATNPTAPVASTLVITVYDMYGHEFDIKLAMTVNPR